MLVAVLDDLLRGDRPDPVDRVELLGGRGAEADRAVLTAAPTTLTGAPPGPCSGTTICCPSARRAARLTASSTAFPLAPPARSTASVTRAPAGSLYTPGR